MPKGLVRERAGVCPAVVLLESWSPFAHIVLIG